jgi:ubiquinone/menaquinone biosynthesis C-methylase UbiE
MGYFLLNPLRRVMQNPEKLLSPYVRDGMWVVDTGCGMGYFTLPLAKLVGATGHVLAVDLQEKMIGNLRKRADKAGLANRIETRVCSSNSLQLDDHQGKVDFALAFAMVHEVPDPDRLLAEFHSLLKAGGCLLLAEPSFHVSKEAFAATLALAEQTGFAVTARPSINKSQAALLTKHSS